MQINICIGFYFFANYKATKKQVSRLDKKKLNFPKLKKSGYCRNSDNDTK